MGSTMKFVLVTLLILGVVYGIIHFILHKIGKDRRNLLPANLVSKVKFPLIILLLAIALQAALIRQTFFSLPEYFSLFNQIKDLLFILSFSWFVIIGIRTTKKVLLKRYDITLEDNLRARKHTTQFNILERILISMVIVLGIGFALLSFEGIQEVGVSILTSAGIAGIILGLSAQKMIGTLIAGVQIALTQPIRVDDVVIVEGEWGRIEEIRLTYVVVNIWDKRRLVVPTTYFIDQPFENWTRTTSELLGTVYLYVDYRLPLDELRKEQTRILQGTSLWNGKVDVIQVVEGTEKTMQIRSLVSAKDSGTAWELRVLVREKLIGFIRDNYPESLPTARVHLENTDKTTA